MCTHPFLTIAMAEFGDKTQITMNTLSSELDVFAVCCGATLTEILVCVIRVVAGRELLKCFTFQRIHKLSGLFLLLAPASAVNGDFLLINTGS